jgi:hypothetical protein
VAPCRGGAGSAPTPSDHQPTRRQTLPKPTIRERFYPDLPATDYDLAHDLYDQAVLAAYKLGGPGETEADRVNFATCVATLERAHPGKGWADRARREALADLIYFGLGVHFA